MVVGHANLRFKPEFGLVASLDYMYVFSLFLVGIDFKYKSFFFPEPWTH